MRGLKVSRASRIVFLIAIVAAAIGCDDGTTTTDPAIQAVDSGGPLPEKGPDEYWVKFDTTRGDVFIEVHRNWSPYGADRFYELVKSGFYDRCKFFRVAGFMVQFGISGDPAVNAKWKDANIPDDKFKHADKNRQSNKRGYVSFVKSVLPNSRTTQLFINCIDNPELDAKGFTPFAIVLSGMDAIDTLYSRYGDEPTRSQERMEKEGDAYLSVAFPGLDSIKSATLLAGKPDLPKKADDSKKTESVKKPEDAKKPDEPKPSASPPAPPTKDAAKKPAG
jgi:peptidyl-prolyl cis-trans isomerase A (cyclophilin A)